MGTHVGNVPVGRRGGAAGLNLGEEIARSGSHSVDGNAIDQLLPPQRGVGKARVAHTRELNDVTLERMAGIES